MAYKFSCPSCGQHFAGDFGYCGLELTCPACQQPFTVPNPGSSAPVASASGPRAQRTTVALPAKLPLRPPAQATPAPVTPRTSGLAVASLVCSIGSLVVIPLALAGVICGHMAVRRIDRNPGWRGRGMAKAGLIIGYLVILLWLLLLVAIAIFGFSLAKLFK